MRAFLSSRAFLSLCVLSAGGSSCYSLRATEGGAPTLGREVVLELSERGAIELAPQLGQQLKSVTGRVAGVDDTGYRMTVSQTNSRTGVETLWRGEQALIQRGFVLSVAERRLDKGRSWLVAAISAVGVALASRALGGGSGPDGVPGTGGGTRQ